MRGILVWVVLLFLLLPVSVSAQALIVDHNAAVEFDDIPDQWIEQVKQDFRISYGHTSHGSQIITGMNLLSGERDDAHLIDCGHYGSAGVLYSCCEDYGYTLPEGTLSFWDGEMDGASDLGNPDRTAWADATRNHLDGVGGDRNLIIWSWCGQHATATTSEIDLYLSLMNQLEQDYPDVTFVYMTGHLNSGSGPPDGMTYLRNKQIRDYCINNDKVLFDFADIESWDPDGNYYPQEDDACNWCSDWCSTHSCPSCSTCAHSHCFNCYNKGKAFWWMLAKLAGWDGGSPSQECSDGTPYGQCSISQPEYCDNGILVDDCNTCDCPSGQTCQVDGSCLYSGSGELVSYWSFDDSANPGKDQAGVNDGTVYGAIWTANGFSNGAVSFDGANDYIDCGSDSSLNLNDFTLTAWMKLNVITSSSNLIARKTDSPYNGWNFFFYGGVVQGLAFAFFYGDGSSNTHKSYYADEDLLADKWYQVAVAVSNGNSIRFYVNGTLDAEKAPTESFIYPDSPLIIGESGSGYHGEAMNGIIDEVKIYNKALSSEEILRHYNEEMGEDITADLNNDGVVDIYDLINVTTYLGQISGFDENIDVVPDGIIDIYDVVYIASRFTKKLPPECTGTCKDNPCSSYDDCSSASGECPSGQHCCSGSCTIPGGDVVYAASCSLSDVQAAIDSAENGDIVQIPAGTCYWNGNILTWKEIHLRGEGPTLTIIRKASDERGLFIYEGTWDSPSTPNQGQFKFSGIKLVDPEGPYSQLDDTKRTNGLIIRYGARDFLVYDSEFEGFGNAGVLVYGYPTTTHALIPDGRCRGVIYNNRFIDCYMPGLGYGVDVVGTQDIDWENYPLALGTEEAVFIEDNYFKGTRHAVASSRGSRYVFRYNIVEDNIGGEHSIDAHGWTGTVDDVVRGSRQYEIYENEVIGDPSSRPNGIGIRGGDGVIFNNTMHTGISGYPIFLTQDNQGICLETGWPCLDQIRELHMWGNTKDGVAVDTVGTCSECVRLTKEGIEQTLQEGRDFFLYPRPGYTPYPYPHPLRE